MTTQHITEAQAHALAMVVLMDSNCLDVDMRLRVSRACHNLANAAIQHYIDSSEVIPKTSLELRIEAALDRLLPSQPVAPQPMTEVEISDMMPINSSMNREDTLRWMARAVERHHGIIGVKPAPQPMTLERKQIPAARLNEMWAEALEYADPTAGNAHILYARAIEEEGK